MSEPRTELGIDYQTVTTAERNTASIETRINTFQAAPSEVMTWNFAQDPLLEDLTWYKIVHQKLGSSQAFEAYASASTNKNRLYADGAAILVASVGFPEIPFGKAGSSLPTLEQFYFKETPEHMIGNKDAPLSPDDIIRLSLNRLTFRKLSVDDLQQLFTAAEMLQTSISFGKPVESPKNPKLTNHSFNAFYALQIYRTIVNKADVSTDPEVQLLGLRAKRALFANAVTQIRYNPDGFPDYEEGTRQDAYLEYIGALEKFFLQGNIKNLNAPETRGLLHEMLWVLDANLYLDHQGNKDWFIYPSTLAQDAPQIGYPKGNRGFDYRVQTNWSNRLLVQLKSKGQVYHNKKYHPLIRVLNETHFNDTNPNRLAARFKIFRRFLEQPTDESWNQARGFLLGSATDFIDDITRIDNPIAHSDRLAHAYQRDLPKNKSARRRIIKAQQKSRIQ